MSRRSTSKLKTMTLPERMILQLPRIGLATEGQLEHLGNLYPDGGKVAIQALLNLMRSGVVDCVIWHRESWNGESIVAVTGSDGDKLDILNPVTMPPTAGCTLLYTEGVCEAMLAGLNESLKKISNDAAASTKPIEELAKEFPRQVCLTVQRVRFTTEAQKSIRESQPLKRMMKNSIDLKNRIGVKLLDKDMPDGERATLVALQVLLHEQRQVLKPLAELKEGLWEAWQEQIRFYRDEKEQTIELRMMNSGRETVAEIGNEYSPPHNLISTEFTHTLRWAFLDAMGEGGPRVLVLIGPKASGKNGILRDVGRLLGTLPSTLRCSEESPKALEYWKRWMNAAKVSGGGPCAPVILADAHRLQEDALAAALSAATEFQVALCVTMCPCEAADKYKKGLLEGNPVINVPATDTQCIAQGRLAAEGLEQSEELGGALASILDTLARDCSKQPHYDFGSRTLLQLCGQIGRDRKKDCDEKELVQRVVQRVLIPRMVREDIPVLQKALDAAGFSDVSVSKENEDGRWASVVANIRSITKYEPDCMVCPVSDKDQADFEEEFCKSLNRTTSALVKVPGQLSDMTAEDLLGTMPKCGEEVKDGVLVKLLRKAMEDHQDENQQVWVMIKTGPITRDKWGCLHELLNDSGCLNLDTGEQLRLSEQLRFLFVMEDAGTTDQDTFARSAVVYTDPP